MKRLLLAGAALALLIPAAVHAQSAAPAPAGAPAALSQTTPPPPPPDGGPRGPGGPGGPGMRGPDGPEGPGHRGPPPPPPSPAAHFHLERGDTVVDVKCADNESMKACSDIATAMIDKLAALPPDTK